MIVQVQAISKKSTQQAELLFRQRAAELRARVASKIADEIVNLSPVDTGTYIMAHVAGTGPSDEAPTRSSNEPGRERGQNPQQFKNLARGNLKRSVSAAAIQASNEVWFRNRALHAARVEYDGWTAPLFGIPSSPLVAVPAYHVYAKARARAPQFIRDAAREMGMTAR
jgi:hypothetical protein